MLEKVAAIIREQLNQEDVEITEATRFKEDLEVDSLDLFELVMAFEEEYGVSIPSEERKKDTADADEVKKNVTDESGKTDAAAEWMELYLDQHTDSGNQKAIEIGEKARLSVLWKLADAYERSGMKTEQIQTYGQLIEWEQDPIQLEEAGVRKMKLEAAQGDYKQAAETGKKVLERIEASEKITKMLKGYELYKGEEGES